MKIPELDIDGQWWHPDIEVFQGAPAESFERVTVLGDEVTLSKFEQEGWDLISVHSVLNSYRMCFIRAL